MKEPRVRLSLEDHSRNYAPGDILAGQFSLEGILPHDVRAIELSVLWHTDGKGDEDMSVHYFQRIEASDLEIADLRQPHRFRTALPNSPLSYSGVIIRISWCVRVRVFLARGKELSLDVPFQLGQVPHPQLTAV